MWQPVSVITALCFADSSWALWPMDWLGLYKLLDAVPLSFALTGAGLCFFWGVVQFNELAERKGAGGG
jgi:hypothetical protein